MNVLNVIWEKNVLQLESYYFSFIDPLIIFLNDLSTSEVILSML